jgi:hypothetical protein
MPIRAPCENGMVRVIGVRRHLPQFLPRNNSCDLIAGADVLPVGSLEQRALARFVLE